MVIVGGGAIGVSAAYELALRGARVTLLERGEALASGCSAGNAGLISPSHSMPLATPAALREGLRSLRQPDLPFSVRPRSTGLRWLTHFAAACRPARVAQGMHALHALSVASLDLHAGLASLGTSFEQLGTISVYETEESFAAASLEAGMSSGRAEVLSAEEARALEPALRPGLAGGVFHPDEAHLDPLRYVHAIGEAAAAAGVEIRTGIEVQALRRQNGALGVETPGREYRAATVVLAAGVWTARLARGLGVFVPLTAGKGYHLDLPATAADPRIPVWIHSGRLVATPLAGRLRLAGTLHLGDFDPGVRQAPIEGMRRVGARALLGREKRAGGETWAGLRPCTPDGLPVIGRPAHVPGLILATGHAMKGLALAPVTARLVSELVAGEPPSHDLAPFHP